jgi:hypothetical protein
MEIHDQGLNVKMSGIYLYSGNFPIPKVLRIAISLRWLNIAVAMDELREKKHTIIARKEVTLKK